MPGHRSVIARGLGAEEATRRVAEVLGERPGYVVRALAPGRVVVTRSRRPRWAIWLCVLTVWIFGLGLLFLLVRRTEGADLLVVEGPRGAVVTLPPLVADADARAVEDALGVRSRRPTNRRGTGPRPVASGRRGNRTVRRRRHTPVTWTPPPSRVRNVAHVPHDRRRLPDPRSEHPTARGSVVPRGRRLDRTPAPPGSRSTGMEREA